MNRLGGGTIEDGQHAARINKCTHAATTASAQLNRRNRRFARKRFAVVRRALKVNAAMFFTRRVSGGMPSGVHVAVPVGSDGESSIGSGGEMDQIALRLKSGARIVQPRKKHRHRIVAPFDLYRRTEPDGVNPAISPDGKLRPAHGANRNGTLWD